MLNSIDIVVDPHGNDAAAGTQQAPLRSLTAARDAARQRLASQPGCSVRIMLHGGIFQLAEPLVLGLDDMPGGEATFSW